MNYKALKDRIHIKLIEKTNPFLGDFRRKRGGINCDFTIISNNCWAGNVYRWFNLPYKTPTAGLYFFPDDYIRFLQKIREYCSMEINEINIEDSRHREQLFAKGQMNVPIGIIEDVEIVFLHYPTFKEAREKWKRRSDRICWDNLIVKNSEMNGCTKDHILAFDKLSYDRKFIFTTRDYGISSQVLFREYLGAEQVKDDTTLFNKYINLNCLIKGGDFKRNQER